MYIFDIFDLDRPYETSYYKFERVCRICGGPLRKKDGTYSPHMRYCKKHTGHGDILFTKYNWGMCSKQYIKSIQFKHRKLIKEKLKELDIPNSKAYLVVICEECRKLCQKEERYYYSSPKEEYKKILKSLQIVNVHHIIPVHTLDKSNITLIWDYSNLNCLCIDCHNEKHKSKKLEKGILLSKKHKTLDQFV